MAPGRTLHCRCAPARFRWKVLDDALSCRRGKTARNFAVITASTTTPDGKPDTHSRSNGAHHRSLTGLGLVGSTPCVTSLRSAILTTRRITTALSTRQSVCGEERLLG